MPPLFLLKQPLTPALPFDVRDGDCTARSLREVRRRVAQWWKESHAAGEDPFVTSFAYAALIDQIVDLLYRRTTEHSRLPRPGHGPAIMALGGYGRCEMGPHSDIDLLFLYQGGSDSFIAELTSSLLYPLWDAGMDVGGATRSVKDCERVAKRDVRAFTSMLDARYVAGDRAIADRFQEYIRHRFRDKGVRRAFVRHKLGEHSERRRKFNDSVYLLQPNVKEGEGGLREFHTMVWLTRATYPDADLDDMLMRTGLSDRSVAQLLDSVRFLWRVRHALHLLEDKRQDRLSENLQSAVARMFGFADADLSSDAEQLMQAYYRHASAIHRFSQWTFERMEHAWSGWARRAYRRIGRRSIETGVRRCYGRRLMVTEDALRRDPLLMLRAFVHAKRHRLRFDVGTKEMLEHNSPLIDESLRAAPETHALWEELFGDARHLGEAIAAMHECRCLERWFPEMKPTLHRILHDGFHIYTVDAHTIRAISELSMLMTREGRANHGCAAMALRSLRKPHLVLLATLLHDIGKGQGGDHEELGAEIASRIASRLGYPPVDCDSVAFLVRSHMLMPKLAFRRDVRDHALIERFAQTVRSPQTLAMLYLITFADLRSVGPHGWSAWKEGLLDDLYVCTNQFLIAGGHTEVEQQRTVEKRVRGVLQIMGKGTSSAQVERFIAALPRRYARTVDAPSIAAHLGMLQKLTPSSMVVCDVRNDHQHGLSELSLATADAPGLFARIAGVLTANGLNIIDADLYTTNDGTALDIIRVTDERHLPIEDPDRWRRIIGRLERIGDARTIDGMLRRRLKLRQRRRHRKPSSHVEVDNDVSAEETVLEIHTDDHPGLLYSIAHTIAEHGYSIDRARIATHVDRVVDVFYIRDRSGRKITSQEHLLSLRDALLMKLAEEV